MPITLVEGDIVLTRGTTWFARAIRFFERKSHEAPSWANHAMLAARDHKDGQLKLASMEPVFCKWRTLDDFPKYKVYRIHKLTFPDGRQVELTAVHRALLGTEAAQYVGRFYGMSKIALHLIGLKSWCKIDSFPICSFATSRPWTKVFDWQQWPIRRQGGSIEWVSANAVDPDDLDDSLKTMMSLYPGTIERVTS
jgi:hypothetical protein